MQIVRKKLFWNVLPILGPFLWPDLVFNSEWRREERPGVGWEAVHISPLSSRKKEKPISPLSTPDLVAACPASHSRREWPKIGFFTHLIAFPLQPCAHCASFNGTFEIDTTLLNNWAENSLIVTRQPVCQTSQITCNWDWFVSAARHNLPSLPLAISQRQGCQAGADEVS